MARLEKKNPSGVASAQETVKKEPGRAAEGPGAASLGKPSTEDECSTPEIRLKVEMASEIEAERVEVGAEAATRGKIAKVDTNSEETSPGRDTGHRPVMAGGRPSNSSSRTDSTLIPGSTMDPSERSCTQPNAPLRFAALSLESKGPMAVSNNPCQASTLWILTAAAVLIPLGLRLLAVDLPLERDEGEYAYVAQRMLWGEAPYAEIFNQKTPGAFFIYAAAIKLLGGSPAAFHLAAYLFDALTAFLLFDLTRRLFGTHPAILAALAYGLITVEPRLLALAANTEHFGNLPLGLAAWLLLRPGKRASMRSTAIAGICCGVAVWIKQVTLFPALFFLGLPWIWPPRREQAEPPGRGRLFAAGLAGFALVNGLGAAVIWGLFDAWDAFLDCAVWHNFEYGRRVPPGQALELLAAALRDQTPSLLGIWMLAAIGVLALFGRLSGTRCEFPTDAVSNPVAGDCDRMAAPAASRRLGWLLMAWLAACFLAAASSLHFYQHYFIWMAEPSSVLVGLGGAWLLARLRSVMGGTVTALVMVVLFTAPTLAANQGIWLRRGEEGRLSRLYGPNLFAQSQRIAEYLKKHSAPSDTVLIVGTEPQILYYAGLKSATRYVIVYPLFGPYRDAQERQEEVLREIRTRPPAWILDVRFSNSRTPDPRRPRILEEELFNLLQMKGEYRLDGLAFPDPENKRFVLQFGREARSTAAQLPNLAEKGTALYAREKRK